MDLAQLILGQLHVEFFTRFLYGRAKNERHPNALLPKLSEGAICLSLVTFCLGATELSIAILWLAGIISAALFIYLFYALIKPERF
jgi:K+-transporting ATPase KdpF subunit